MREPRLRQRAVGSSGPSFTGVVEYLGLGASTPSTVTQGFALVIFVGVVGCYRQVLSNSLRLSVALFVVASLIIPRYSFEVYGLYLVLAFPVILMASERLEIVLAALAVWFLTVRDVLPLGGAAVSRFREFRGGVGHLAVAALIIVVLDRQRRVTVNSADS